MKYKINSKNQYKKTIKLYYSNKIRKFLDIVLLIIISRLISLSNRLQKYINIIIEY